MKPLIRDAILYLGFTRSAKYWEQRYRFGRNSGAGSYGDLAIFKAEVLNDFVRTNKVESIIEFGCGDGHQLSLADYPRYLGLDVSKTAIGMCCDRFEKDADKSFLWYDPETSINIEAFLSADLTLSLDVIYHLVEDAVYDRYLHDLFVTTRKYVIIYSSDDTKKDPAPHVRHRRFTADVADRYPEFRLAGVIENKFPQQTPCDFYMFEKMVTPDGCR